MAGNLSDFRFYCAFAVEDLRKIRKEGNVTTRVPFQSGYLCSGICEKQLEFEFLDTKEGEEEKKHG